MIRLGLDNSYRRLPSRFYAAVEPVPVAEPRLVAFNRQLAQDLGLDVDAVERVAAVLFSGNEIAGDSEPIALAYAGHQFGQFVPQLGDGRALLLGEIVDPAGRRRDMQLKGSGPTPFSRRGDGRAALGPMLREYIVSEAMHALGIPTTRALAVVTTGEPVYRETALPGAVLTRVAASHIRVGTFQYFAARRDDEAVRLLAGHVIERHYPHAARAAHPHLALLEAVTQAQASLIARWLHVGFIHGVMNTDNMAVSGETIDYGPCAFLDAYDPAGVFSSIDHGGRYAFANQPALAQWNLARFAETLLPLIDTDTDKAIEAARAVIETFPARFTSAWLAGMRTKIGLARAEDGDEALIASLQGAMHEGRADVTLTFRRLADAAADPQADAHLRALFAQDAPIAAWLERWRARLTRETAAPRDRAAAMRTVNPALIPRNHRVEQALAAAQAGDLAPFERLTAALTRPFDDAPTFADLATPPAPHERVTQTFCGT